MIMRHLVMRTVAASLTVLLGSASSFAQDAKTPEVQAVDALNALFGQHPGIRANHAKGVVATGSFSASPEAAALSRAPHLQGGAVPVTVRFSNASGAPDIPDNSPNANPHGLAIKFKLPDGSDTDVVINSLAFFPVRTIEEFRDLLKAAKASGPDVPKPTPVERFLAEHPKAAQALASAKTPASFATEQYNGIDAFIFVGPRGERTPFRYRVVPVAGVQHLSDNEIAQRGPDYLSEDLEQRLKQGPVAFRVMAQIAEPGDPVDDATVAWPAERRLATLGTLRIEAIAPDNAAASKSLVFFPGNLPEGIEPSGDPLIASRDAAYAESLTRRNQ
jgi:catalase